MGGDKPYRYTKGKLSVETTIALIAMGWAWRFATWGLRRWKPMFYHPIAILGLTIFIWSYIVTAWLTLVLVLAFYVWALVWPDSYLRHVHPRCQSFFAGFRYRHRPRKRLKPMGLLSDDEPVATVSRVRKEGCITKVWIKMQYGDDINWWRDKASRVAQTYGALDCKINPYRRDNFTTFRINKVTLKPPFVQYRFTEKRTLARWLELEFLVKDPFTKRIGVEYLDHYAAEELLPSRGVAIGPCRTGAPYLLDLCGAQMLIVAMSRRGKSNAARAMIRAYHPAVQARLMEFWGLDGKGGVEFSFLQHLLTRYCYGDDFTDPNAFRPEAFAQMLDEAKIVMMRRQKRMRTKTTKHTATPNEPWVVLMIDELLAMTSKLIKPEVRNQIAANIALIQQQGIACGVTIVAFSQLAQKEEIPFRGGFTEFQVGRSEAIVADMLFGTGAWRNGAKVDEIPKDLPGVFYAKNDFSLSPEQFRYVEVTNADVRELAPAPPSALWETREVLSNYPPPPGPQWENPPGRHLEAPIPPEPSADAVRELVSAAAVSTNGSHPPANGSRPSMNGSHPPSTNGKHPPEEPQLEPEPAKRSGPSFGGMR